MRVGHRPQFLVSHPEDIEYEVVAANKNVGAQNIDEATANAPAMLASNCRRSQVQIETTL